MQRYVLVLSLATVTLTLTASQARAATAEQVCQKGRYYAAAKYASCEQKYVGSVYGSSNGFEQVKFSKCRVKYAAAWVKLQEKTTGSGVICDSARFTVNGDGTVTDRLSGLVWEQKTDDASVHDKDNVYTWSASAANAPDGTSFTSFLATLNTAGGCFAGQCDWRLPTRAEAETILAGPFPCSTNPCLDQSSFGPTATGVGTEYWSSTTDIGSPDRAWTLDVDDGEIIFDQKTFTGAARAVRGGL